MDSQLDVRRASLLIVTLLVLSASVVPAAGGADGIRWHRLSAGKKLALAERKPMVVDFYMPKVCARCRLMESILYANPDIIRKMNAEFVPVRIDMSEELTVEEKFLGERFDYRQDCLLVFLDYKGNVVKDSGGKRLCFTNVPAPDEFLKYLEAGKRSSVEK